MKVKENKKMVEVCDKCLTACCWYGFFMCDDAKTAGTVFKSIDELRELKKEHECYWTLDLEKFGGWA